MAPELPTEILENILSWLPAKSLLRFKSVCKLWNTIISHPRFVMKSYPENQFFLVENYRQLSVLRLDDGIFQTEGAPFSRSNEATMIMSIADGIVLLRGQGSAEGNWTYTLWNPITRKEATLPPFPYEFHRNFIHGLCHDPINNDFKVVIGFRFKSSSPVFYSVFSCKEGSWTEKKDFSFRVLSPPHEEYGGGRGLTVDGAIYWVLSEEIEKHAATRNIVYFDPMDNNFKILQKPENDLFYLAESKGRLYLYQGHEYKMVRIWSKEKDSWKMVINFDNRVPVSSREQDWWEMLMEKHSWKAAIDGDNVAGQGLQILIRFGEGSHLIYNHCDKTFKRVQRIPFLGNDLYPYGATTFFPLL